jgi:hypothetical protein
MLLPPVRMLIVGRCRLALALEPVAAPAAAAASPPPPLAVALGLAALLCGQFARLLDEFAVLGRLGLGFGRGGVKVLGRAFLAVRLRL